MIFYINFLRVLIFEIYSFLQPIGLLSTKNPFILIELYRENNPDYKLFKYIYPNIKKLITQNIFTLFTIYLMLIKTAKIVTLILHIIIKV